MPNSITFAPISVWTLTTPHKPVSNWDYHGKLKKLEAFMTTQPSPNHWTPYIGIIYQFDGMYVGLNKAWTTPLGCTNS